MRDLIVHFPYVKCNQTSFFIFVASEFSVLNYHQFVVSLNSRYLLKSLFKAAVGIVSKGLIKEKLIILSRI